MKMDIDPSKPVYIFVLDFLVLGEPTNVSDLPKDLLNRCRHLCDIGSDEKRPAIAVRGSTPQFGSWNTKGLRAAELTPGRYAFLVNDWIPKDAQYKWLNMNGVTITGDLDHATGYHYEPDPFVDRRVGEVVAKPEQVVFVFNTWGRYSRSVERKLLHEWMPDATKDVKGAEESKDAPVSVDKAVSHPEETSTENITKESDVSTETKDVRDDVTEPLKPTLSSTGEVVDTKVPMESTETLKTDHGKKEDIEKQKTEISEKEQSMTSTGEEGDTNVDIVTDESSVTLKTENEEKEVTEKQGSEILEKEVTGNTQTHEEAASGNHGKEESGVTTLPQSDKEDDDSLKEVDDPEKKEENSLESGEKEIVEEPVKLVGGIEETSTDKVPSCASQVQNQQIPDTNENTDNKTEGLANGANVNSANDETKPDDDIYKSENGESFMASEEIEMSISTTTVSSAPKQDGDSEQTPDTNQNTTNNNTIVVTGKSTGKDDTSTAEEMIIEKVNNNVSESVNLESVGNEKVSEATFKRMSRISSSEAPEVDQVNEVIVCTEQCTITVTKSRLPSSSSC